MIPHGIVLSARSGLIEAQIPCAAVGDGVRMLTKTGSLYGTVSGVTGSRASIALHDDIDGVAIGDDAALDVFAGCMPLGAPLLGRCIDARGNPLDGGAPVRGRPVSIDAAPPSPAQREPVTRACWTGIRAIDALMTIGRGARIGVFGFPGTGKSTLLQMLVAGAYADAVVVGLVGERGREAEEWIRNASPHASIVCATSDRGAAERIRGARIAFAQAATLRARGLHVLLILDSLARYAMALRELGIAKGEPLGRGGYPASVFAELARAVEVAGNASGGSITLVATVLSEGDERDPISEGARSLLDGHIELSPVLARRGHFPAIDVAASVSRTMSAAIGATHAENAAVLRRAISALSESEDARALGIVPEDPFTLRAVAVEGPIQSFLRQETPAEQPERSLSALAALADRVR